MSKQNASIEHLKHTEVRSGVLGWLQTSVLLGCIGVLGVVLRNHLFQESMLWPDAPFWIESAMRFRIIQWLGAGEPLPTLDYAMQWPEGYSVYQDVLVQELILGGLARLWAPEVLSDFVRAATRVIFCLIVFPLYLLGRQLSGSRRAALAAVTLYLFIPPSVDRSTGLVIYRENICLIFISIHLYLLVYYFNYGGPNWWTNEARPCAGKLWAWVALVSSGLFLTLAHFTWKVIPFYQLFVQLILSIFFIFNGNQLKLKWSIVALCGFPVLASLLPGPLNVDRYWGSANAALACALVITCGVFSGSHARGPWWARALVLALGTGILLGMLPGARSYSHAWDTLWAKVIYLGIKPEDPALLPISARHYWTGNYSSPTLARALRDFFVPMLLLGSLIGQTGRRLLFHVQGLEPGHARSVGSGPEGHPMESRSGPSSAWVLNERHCPTLLILGGVVAFSLGYLLFYKFGTLLALFLCPLLAVAACGWYERARHRAWMVHGLLVGAAGVAFLSSWNNLGAEQVLSSGAAQTSSLTSEQVGRQAEEENVSAVYPVDALNELALWLKDSVAPRAPLLASWPLAPYLVTYLQKTVVLHAYFECPNVFTVEEHYRRMFAPLAELHAFAQARGAQYIILEAHMLLRTDRWMSWRYVADRLQLDGTEAAYRLHYTPEDTPGFVLAYQNRFFRVYRVLSRADQKEPAPALVPAPLFDLRIPGAQVGATTTQGATLLYGTLEAMRHVQLGDSLLAAGQTADAVAAWKTAIEIGPYCPEPYLRLLRMLRSVARSAVDTTPTGSRGLPASYYDGTAAQGVRNLAVERFGASLWEQLEDSDPADP